MNFKKRVNGSWVDTPYYIHNTATDTLTTLPAVLYPNDTTATIGLKGQMEQNGTPTPTTPIQPSECGELDRQTVDITYSFSGYNQEIRTGGIADAIKSLTPAKWTFTWDFQSNATQSFKNRMRIYVNGSNRMEISNGETVRITEELLNGIRNSSYYSVILYCGQDNSDGYFKDFVIDAGYKIPILSAGQTTPVYLGEVETTRKIKKYEMTGNEDIIYQSAYSRFYFLVDDAYYSGTVRTTPCICSHYQSIHDGRTIDDVPNESIYIVTGDNNKTSFNIKTTDYTTATDFKTYLASQYVAGTPVTIWYVLATPTTGIVNEPLRKIGDYADTVSGISIPVTAGANTIDIDTTLKPSEVSVNYKGWHPVQSVHEAENGAWT